MEQYLLSFQIRSLQEQALCDVVEMDACHILIVRPWLFDKKGYQDGGANTYEFMKYGQRYKLTPMMENAVEVT